MEKENLQLGQLSPEENEKRVDRLESEMRAAGAEYEVCPAEAPRLPWHKRILRLFNIKQ